MNNHTGLHRTDLIRLLGRSGHNNGRSGRLADPRETVRIILHLLRNSPVAGRHGYGKLLSLEPGSAGPGAVRERLVAPVVQVGPSGVSEGLFVVVVGWWRRGVSDGDWHGGEATWGVRDARSRCSSGESEFGRYGLEVPVG